MARTAEYQYARPIYGSAAPDFGSFPMPEPRYVEPEIELPEIQAQPKAGERAQVRPAVRTRQAVAPMAILGYLAAGALLVIVLIAQISLNAISAQSAKLEAQLTALQTENTRLTLQYETTFNFTEIEDYAVNRLGMQAPAQGQIFYLQTDAPDKTLILTPPADGGGLLNRISDALSSLGNYLK